MNNLPTDLKACHALIKELRDEVKLWREYADQGASQDEIAWVGALADAIKPLWTTPNQCPRTGCRALVALAMYPGRVCSKSVFHDYFVTLACTSRNVRGDSARLADVAIWSARKAAVCLGFEPGDIKTHYGRGFGISDRLRAHVVSFKS